jgi:peptidoglycan/LPS O-acetylase OafA/YrhL
MAVELFFVISGFYMQLILSTRYTKAKLGSAWLSQFYKARYFRLLPTYLLGSSIVVAAGLCQPSLAPLSIWRYIWGLPGATGNFFFKIFLCFTNTTILFQDATMFFSARNGLIHWSANFRDSGALLWQGLTIPPAWSLGIELDFYFIAPYLLKLRSRWLLIGCCCCLAVKGIAIKALHLGDPWTYRFFPFELGYFLLGAIAFRHRHLLDHLLPERIEKYCVYPVVIGFAACRLPVPFAKLAYPMALACFLPLLFRVTSGLKADRLVGELSYPFYVFHWFSLTLGGDLVRHWMHISKDSVAWTGLWLTLALSIVTLALEIHFIEPWRGRFARTAAIRR